MEAENASNDLTAFKPSKDLVCKGRRPRHALLWLKHEQKTFESFRVLVPKRNVVFHKITINKQASKSKFLKQGLQVCLGKYL